MNNPKNTMIPVSELKPIWLPEPWQIIMLRNPNYLNSVFIGLTNPIWNLPTMVWTLLLAPVLRGLYFILRFIVSCVVLGIMGRVTALPIPQPGFTVQVVKQPPALPED